MNVIMLATNSVINDVRIIKEAKAVQKLGANVKIFGVDNKSNNKDLSGIEIILSRNPRLLSYVINLGINLKNKKSGKDTYKTEDKFENKSKGQYSWKRISETLSLLKGILIKLNLDSIGKILYSSVKKNAERVDVIHCHDLDTLAVGYRLKRLYKCKLIYDSHELWTEMTNINPYVKKMFTRREASIIKHADKVITVSPSICKELRDRYSLRTLPTQICNMPENSEEIIVSRPENNEVKIIYVGYYIPGRGIVDIIEVIKRLPGSFKLFLRVQPSKEIIEELEHEIKESNSEHRIKVLPFVSQNEVVNEISNYDIGILPYQAVSLNNFYCLPNKLFQYLAGGVCVVANFLPDVKDVLEGNNCGLVYNYENLDSLKNILMELADNKEKLYCLKKNARMAFNNIYNWNTEVKKLNQIYNDFRMEINNAEEIY